MKCIIENIIYIYFVRKILEIIYFWPDWSSKQFLRKIYFLFERMFFRSLTATFSGKIEFSVVSDSGEKVFRKKKSIKVYFYNILYCIN